MNLKEEIQIPNEDHIARYCKPKTIDEEGNVLPIAFMLRKGETSLSVNWLEFLNCPDREKEINKIRKIYSKKFKKVPKKAKISILNVGDIKAKLTNKIKVIHDPTLVDSSHSGIIFLNNINIETIATLIVELVLETHSAG